MLSYLHLFIVLLMDVYAANAPPPALRVNASALHKPAFQNQFAKTPDAAVSIFIDDAFEGDILTDDNIPRDIQKLRIIDKKGLIRKIAREFLWNRKSLTHLILDGFDNTTTIGPYFLYDCSYLHFIKLIGFKETTTIHAWCLYNCTRLREVIFPAFDNVTDLGEGCLANCSFLPRLSLNGLNKLRAFDQWFLHGCICLEKLTLTGCASLQTIAPFFLNDLDGLVSLNLPSFPCLTNVGIGFCDGTPVELLLEHPNRLILQGICATLEGRIIDRSLSEKAAIVQEARARLNALTVASPQKGLLDRFIP